MRKKDGDILIFIKPSLEEKEMIKQSFDITNHDIASSLDEEELRLDDEKKNFFSFGNMRGIFLKKQTFEISFNRIFY